MRVVVLLLVLVVTTGKQSQLPGLAWDGSLTIGLNSSMYHSKSKIYVVTAQLNLNMSWSLTL